MVPPMAAGRFAADMSTHFLRLEDCSSWHGCVLAYGHFNTIHPGHIRYLRHTRGLGDKLVVALIGDGKTSTPFNKRRAEALSFSALLMRVVAGCR